MKERIAFRNQIREHLASLDAQTLSYDESEFWMIRAAYAYIEHYALDRGLRNTAIALPLARGLHNGVHRKSMLMWGGTAYRQPYVIHCLQVCRMLLDIKVPLSREEEDILLASALCHDMVEDIPFPNHGEELVEVYGLDPRVLEVVRLVSKRKDFTPEQEREHFRKIQENCLALLVKLSDRSHNVEDLYNMSTRKVHSYIEETEAYILPMCGYGRTQYPELEKSLDILEDKIRSLTHVAAVLVDRCEERMQELQQQLQALREENAQLRRMYEHLWEE